MKTLKLEEYLNSLPQEIITGESVELPKSSVKDIFRFADVNENDVFYHLGCGKGSSLVVALNEFHVKKAVGVDNNAEKLSIAEKNLNQEGFQADLINDDIRNVDLNEATVILFWFTDEKVIEQMMTKFKKLKNDCKILTIWSPLPNCIPDKIEFPYLLHKVPFREAKNVKEQLLSIFGVKCIDFVTAWEFAERYTKAISTPDSENDRFLTILQSVTIWINARNQDISCTKEIPESVSTYITILKKFFGIDVEHLLK